MPRQNPAHAPPELGVREPKYQALQLLIGVKPIDVINRLRAQTIVRGDGSKGPVTFAEIAEHLTERAQRAAGKRKMPVGDVAVSAEAVRRWWRLAHPDAPQRKPRAARQRERAYTLAELEQIDPEAVRKMRDKL
jgi:hypothetical protein